MEAILNNGKIEQLSNDQKVMFTHLIDVTCAQVNFTNTLVDRNKPMAILGEQFTKTMKASGIKSVIDLWNNPNQSKYSASTFVEIVESPPEQKIAGFKIKDSFWPIFHPSELKDKNLFVLDESQIKEIYIALGGDKTKAEQMFPTPVTLQ